MQLPTEYLQIALGISAVLAALMGALVSYTLLRDFRSSHEANRAILSDTREYYEARIKDLVERLTATKDRWEEVNHLVLSGQSHQSDALQAFNPDEIPIFTDHGLLHEDLSIVPDLAFVLTPVLPSEEGAYQTISRACSDVGLRAFRADAEFAPGDILRQIIRYIAMSRVIVANVSIRNPNVYYELGIAHALGKPTILISRTVDQVSFDISANRVITYSSEDELRLKLTKALKAALSGQSYLTANKRD